MKLYHSALEFDANNTDHAYSTMRIIARLDYETSYGERVTEHFHLDPNGSSSKLALGEATSIIATIQRSIEDFSIPYFSNVKAEHLREACGIQGPSP